MSDSSRAGTFFLSSMVIATPIPTPRVATPPRSTAWLCQAYWVDGGATCVTKSSNKTMPRVDDVNRIQSTSDFPWSVKKITLTGVVPHIVPHDPVVEA